MFCCLLSPGSPCSHFTRRVSEHRSGRRQPQPAGLRVVRTIIGRKNKQKKIPTHRLARRMDLCFSATPPPLADCLRSSNKVRLCVRRWRLLQMRVSFFFNQKERLVGHLQVALAQKKYDGNAEIQHQKRLKDTRCEAPAHLPFLSNVHVNASLRAEMRNARREAHHTPPTYYLPAVYCR